MITLYSHEDLCVEYRAGIGLPAQSNTGTHRIVDLNNSL